MIDKFTVFLPHFLMALAVWRLLKRDDLDDDPSLPSRRAPFRNRRQQTSGDADA
ncbi:hypothetical protein HGI47_00545 [Novosphingobium sp. ERN07]|uniref:hypothetical protein n=1 Tax=unclassified Novosphingobium TaxID=2644732 RepID=UPI00145632EA|nr:hypothetical protein [Novosphingobium sp. ERN07]NLR69361.1 hypothetical protein [Novosphingobium sp. ERN07]